MDELIAVGADHLWVDDTGGDGVPVVLMHPGITDSTIWDRVLPHLHERRVVRFDRRGFGNSPLATEPFVPVEDLYAVLAHRGITRAHLVGNSMGGEIALAAAVSRPDLVASLTVMCPGINGYPWPDPLPEEVETYERYRAAKEVGDIHTLLELSLDEWCRSGVDEYLREQVRNTIVADLDQDELEQPDPPQWESAPSISVPTTVIATELDPRESLEASTALAEQIPGATLLVLPFDHLPQYRDPVQVAAAVLVTVARAESAGPKG